MKNRASTGPTIAADDPRIRAWIDGRLDGADAAAIAAAVAASADLTRIVTELRAVRDASSRRPSMAPPPEATRHAIDAVASSAPGEPGTPDDAAIDSEWRRIEAERIAQEREEAREDLLDLEPPRRRWPWLAFAVALASGVIAALVLNSPEAVSRRMVASRPDQATQEALNPTVTAAVARDVAPAEGDRLAGRLTDSNEGISVVVAGPEGRRLLATLLVEAGVERPDGPDGDEQVRGAGIGEAGAAIDDDRLEIAADAETVERFLATLADQPADSPVRLASRALAVPDVSAPGEFGSGTASEATGLRRLVIRLLVDDLPPEAAGPTPESLEE